MSERVVVVGAGHAAGQFAARLRAEGFAGQVDVVGEEQVPPYQRPPLSKAYLAGEVDMGRVLLRDESFYNEQGIGLHLGQRVQSLDLDAGRVQLTDSALGFDHLVLATGARVRRLALAGADLDGVHYLRTVVDADGLRQVVQHGRRLAVIGAGYIGLEVAAVAAQAGLAVTVLEAQPRILARVASEPVAAHLAAVHASHGVDIRCGAQVQAIEGDGRASGVRLADGERIDADAVVIGVGIVPNTELAETAGLAVDDGIVVDDCCRTGHPRVMAIGDCTRHPSRIYGRALRLESVHNAMSQARVAAAVLAGKQASYDELPWFWSDQYDLKLQIAGLADGHDSTVLRGDPASGSFSVFCMRDGRVLAADSVNAMRDHLECRKLAGADRQVDAARLADVEVPLKEV